MMSNLSIAVYAFARYMLTSFSVVEILLLKYVKWSTNFFCLKLPLKVEIAASCSKHIYSILFVFRLRPMPFAACSRLRSKNLYCKKCQSLIVSDLVWFGLTAYQPFLVR